MEYLLGIFPCATWTATCKSCLKHSNVDAFFLYNSEKIVAQVSR